MKRMVAGFLLLALVTFTSIAQDKKDDAKSENAFTTLKKEYDEVYTAYAKDRTKAMTAYRTAKEEDEKKEAKTKLDEAIKAAPEKKYAGKFFELAEKDPKAPYAFDAAKLAMSLSDVRRGQDYEELWVKVVTFVQKNYADKAEIAKSLKGLANIDHIAAMNLIREVMGKNPDKAVQGAACRALMKAYENQVEATTELKNDADTREQFIKVKGQAAYDEKLANLEKAQQEAKNLRAALSEKYGIIIPDLTIGKTVPEVLCKDLDGKDVKLSDYKGKVVVMDIWATWCGPCIAMIPHEREMVERLKDKPFALISISADDKKETVTKFMEKTKMPWTHWWQGPEGGIMEDWEIAYFPTIYVIDAKGTIRHKDLRGEKLEEAVEKLLKEVQDGK